MFHVYILESEITGRHYVGHTSDLAQRLGQHNNGITKSTKNRGPWKLILQEDFPTRADAMRSERFLKTGQGREELKRLLVNFWQAPVRSSNHGTQLHNTREKVAAAQETGRLAGPHGANPQGSYRA